MPKYSVFPHLSGSAPNPVVVGESSGAANDRVLLGRLNETGSLRKVELDVTGELVVAIFGKRGSGKSYTLGALAEGLCTVRPTTDIGASTHQKAVLLLDTLNVFWSTENPFAVERDGSRFKEELARLSSWRIVPPELDVTVWIPSGYRSNHTPEHYRDFAVPTSELTTDDLADLFDVDPQRDLMGQLLSEVHAKVAAKGSSFSFDDMVDVLEDDDEVSAYYSVGTIRATRQRLRALAKVPVFSAQTGTPLKSLLRPGSLSVLELGQVPNSLRAVITSVLLRRIHSERAQASDVEKQLALNTRLTPTEVEQMKLFLEQAIPPAWVLIDEAQNILPSDRAVKSSDAVTRFVREGRNFGLSFALTTQQPSAVDPKILAQADTVICHKLTVAGDIASMRANIKSPEPSDVKAAGKELELASWLRSLEMGQAIVTNTEMERVFALEVRPRICPHGGTGFVAPQADA